MTEPRPSAPPSPPPGRDPFDAVLELVIRVAGGGVALAGGVLVGVLGLIMVPLRATTPFGLVRIPVAVVFVVAANAALIWFAAYTTRARWGPLVPAAGWFLIAIPAAAGRSTDGSLLLVGDDWVGVLVIFSGTAVTAVGAVTALMRRPAPR